MTEIIEAYGLFWNAADVDWSKGGNARTLCGRPAWQKTAKPIDFASQVGIYVLYAGHQMIYVGQAGSGRATLFGRLRRHHSGLLAGRWDHFSWFGLCSVRKDGKLGSAKKIERAKLTITLNKMEAILIAAAEPVLNKQGGKFGRQRRYVQVRDERLGPTESEMIQEIYNRVQQQE